MNTTEKIMLGETVTALVVFVSTALTSCCEDWSCIGEESVGFPLDIFVSIVVFLLSLQYWRIGGYQILALEYTNWKSGKTRLELKLFPCSSVPNRGLAKKSSYKSHFVKYCYSQPNTFFYGAGNSVVCFYSLTFLTLLAFFYSFFVNL